MSPSDTKPFCVSPCRTLQPDSLHLKSKRGGYLAYCEVNFYQSVTPLNATLTSGNLKVGYSVLARSMSWWDGSRGSLWNRLKAQSGSQVVEPKPQKKLIRKAATGSCSENEHTVFPIYHFIVIVVCFYNI